MSSFEEVFNKVFEEEIYDRLEMWSYNEESNEEDKRLAISFIQEDFLKDLKTLIKLNRSAINAKQNEDYRGW